MRILIDNLYYIMGLASLSVVFTDFKPIQRPLKRRLKSKKGFIPFLIYEILSCNKCFALWSSGLYFHLQGVQHFDVLLLAAITCVASQYIFKKSNILFQ